MRDGDVLTSAEAARFLRVPESDVLDLAGRQELPGRQIGSEWRFHRAALADWLRAESPTDRLMRHAGAAQDDPNLEAMLRDIYQRRTESSLE
jgi:excisionase family DNA binding protein